jgi:hypothetical protein
MNHSVSSKQRWSSTKRKHSKGQQKRRRREEEEEESSEDDIPKEQRKTLFHIWMQGEHSLLDEEEHVRILNDCCDLLTREAEQAAKQDPEKLPPEIVRCRFTEDHEELAYSGNIFFSIL